MARGVTEGGMEERKAGKERERERTLEALFQHDEEEVQISEQSDHQPGGLTFICFMHFTSIFGGKPHAH